MDLERHRWAQRSLTAVVFLLICVVGGRALASPSSAGPGDALTLIRQALAALEVTPPAGSVALGKIIQALLVQDTRGVDMVHVQEAARALGVQDTAGAVAQLIDALPPGQREAARERELFVRVYAAEVAPVEELRLFGRQVLFTHVHAHARHARDVRAVVDEDDAADWPAQAGRLLDGLQ